MDRVAFFLHLELQYLLRLVVECILRNFNQTCRRFPNVSFLYICFLREFLKRIGIRNPNANKFFFCFSNRLLFDLTIAVFFSNTELEK